MKIFWFLNWGKEGSKGDGIFIFMLQKCDYTKLSSSKDQFYISEGDWQEGRDSTAEKESIAMISRGVCQLITKDDL